MTEQNKQGRVDALVPDELDIERCTNRTDADYAAGWNACREKVLDLNADTAPAEAKAVAYRCPEEFCDWEGPEDRAALALFDKTKRICPKCGALFSPKRPAPADAEPEKRDEQKPYADGISAMLERTDWTPEEALRFYAEQKNFDTVNGRVRIIDNGAIASNALKHVSLQYAYMKGDVALTMQHTDADKRDAVQEALEGLALIFEARAMAPFPQTGSRDLRGFTFSQEWRAAREADKNSAAIVRTYAQNVAAQKEAGR